jgi:hypothetical protein
MLLSCLRRGYVTHAGAAGKKRWPSARIGVKAAIAVERAAAQCPAALVQTPAGDRLASASAPPLPAIPSAAADADAPRRLSAGRRSLSHQA